MKSREFPNGWSVVMDKGSTLYSVIVRNSCGDVHDKMRCDTYRGACDWYRAFTRIAKTAR